MVTQNPRGTGKEAWVRTARFAPLPPTRPLLVAWGSVNQTTSGVVVDVSRLGFVEVCRIRRLQDVR